MSERLVWAKNQIFANDRFESNSVEKLDIWVGLKKFRALEAI